MMFQRQQPPPKGDIQPLWDLLGVEVASDRIVWQDYNPSPRLNQLPDEFVFIDRRSGDGQDGRKPAFNPENPISRYLEYVLLPFPSSMTGRNAASTEFEPLIRTNRAGGYVLMREMRQMSMFGPAGLNPNRRHVPESSQFVLAAQVTGEVESPMPPSVGEEAEQQTPEKSKLNVVVVGDIDMLTEQFYQIRQQANLPGAGVNLNFDNITFVLNAIDAVAGDMRFIEIRSRRPRHRTLQKIDARTEEARKKTAQEREGIQEEFDNAVEEEEEKLQERLDAIQERMEQENVSTTDILTSVASARKTGQDRIEKIRKELAKKRDRKLKRIESDLQEKIKTVQGWFKFWAIVLPPIPPLFLAVFVWGYRSSREKRTMPRVRRRS
jgi:ABC-2 type transport system permease protein